MKNLKKLLLLLSIISLSTNTNAQLLKLNSGTFEMDGIVLANDYIVPNGPGQDPVVIFDDEDCTEDRNLIAGFRGHDFGFWCHAEALESSAFPYSTTRSGINGYVYVNGDNSSTVTITWDFGAQAFSCSKEGYSASATNVAFSELIFDIVSAPANQLVNIYFQYTAFAGIGTDHENTNEDRAQAIDSLYLVGTELFQDANKNMSFQSPPGLSGWNEILGKTGVINATVGMPIDLAIETDLLAIIDQPAKTCDRNDSLDVTSAHYRGELILSIDPIEYPDPYVLQDDDLGLFSVDIGGDTELSDQNTPNDNVFDAGDAYKIKGAFMAPPGNDGIVDDSTLLGIEVAPSHPNTGAPVLSGTPPSLVIPAFHDMDGIDLLATKLNIAVPRLSGQVQPCLKSLKHVFISYDDDTPEHYTSGVPSIPSMAQSSGLDTTFGTSVTKDEVVQLNFSSVPPYSAAFEIPLWTEADVHPNLTPNPDFNEALDDDVDALDISEGLSTCPIIYFSVDHEATGNTLSIPMLDPGVIYEYQNNTLTAVIDPVVDLGLTIGVDIDAFEFILILDSNNVNTFKQALVFSVDDDDPLTPTVDESGGLRSNVLYASYYDGTALFPLGNGQVFKDDIDAISAWHYPLTGTQVDIPTGIRNIDYNELNYNVSVYPNPVNSESFVRLKNPIQEQTSISIIAMDGKIISHRRLPEKLFDQNIVTLKDILSLKDLAKGIYSIQVHQNKQLIGTAKFVF